MKEFLKKTIFNFSERFGKAPLCNGREETTFEVFGFRFILCYRCTFIIIGLILSVFLLERIFYFRSLSRKYQVFLIILFLSFTVIDGVIQYFLGIESSNFRRITTGFLAGVGFGLMVEIIFETKPNKKARTF
jgi:uncharacterized membrane protein